MERASSVTRNDPKVILNRAFNHLLFDSEDTRPLASEWALFYQLITPMLNEVPIG